MLSKLQQQASEKIQQWYGGSEQSFVLAGYAGTGKTFMVLHAMESLGISFAQVAFMTFTGKASLVLTQKSNGKFTAHTLHHVLYEPVQTKNGVEFVLKPKKEFNRYKLFVVDECSMPDDGILTDLMSLHIPVLFVGDHGQLEPIGKKTWLYEKLQNADFTLTEIHRQAEDNPIIHLSMLAREGKRIKEGSYGGKVHVMRKSMLKKSEKLQRTLVRADQVLCGYNKTRDTMNKWIRKKKGFTSNLPEIGDKLICTRNNWKKTIPDAALVNGLIGFVKHVQRFAATRDTREHLRMNLQPDFSNQTFYNLQVLPQLFTGEEYVDLKGSEYNEYHDFDFGQVITVHKSQGSEWKNVVLIDEAFGDKRRHRYTGITRAGERLIYLI